MLISFRLCESEANILPFRITSETFFELLHACGLLCRLLQADHLTKQNALMCANDFKSYFMRLTQLWNVLIYIRSLINRKTIKLATKKYERRNKNLGQIF